MKLMSHSSSDKAVVEAAEAEEEAEAEAEAEAEEEEEGILLVGGTDELPPEFLELAGNPTPTPTLTSTLVLTLTLTLTLTRARPFSRESPAWRRRG